MEQKMDEQEQPENPVRFFDIERMTPQQRLDRFAELLAAASLRLIVKQTQAKSNGPVQNQLDGI